MKTGTPPRLDGRTIDWASLEMQPGDDPPEPFSMLTERIDNPQIQCGITRTVAATHEIIRANVHRSPMYSGQIASRGPRYCPSIEDKIVKFGERDGHQIFLEPEGLDDTRFIRTEFRPRCPKRCSTRLVATIPGLEKAQFVRPGYAIEYDYVDPRELEADAWKPSACAGYFWPARSTAPQATKRLRHRDFLPASTRRRWPAAASEIMFDRARSLYRRDDRRSRDARRQRAVSHVHLARRISSARCAPTMPISA